MKQKIFSSKLLIPATFAIVSMAAYFGFLALYNVDISYESPEELGDVVIVKYGPFVSEVAAKTSFDIEPEIEGELIWHEDYKELHFIPTEGFEPDKEYKVTINNKPGLLASAPLSSNAFTFSAVSFYSSPSVTGSYIEQDRYIDANLTTMTMTLIENGQAIKTYPIARKGNPWTKPTREGTFTIKTKEPNHWSRISLVWMPYSMQYSGNYFIHEWPLTTWGTRISNIWSSGCISLHPGDAKEVFDWARIGTTLVVHSTEGRLPVFSATTIASGELVREENGTDVYITKKAGGREFKRHAWTDRFGEWYSHLSPFWNNIKLVVDGSLDKYIESNWVQVDLPQDRPEARYVYELDTRNKTRHLMLCGETLQSQQVKPEACRSSWNLHGWPVEEIYTISKAEFDAYAEGEPKILQISSHVAQ